MDSPFIGLYICLCIIVSCTGFAQYLYLKNKKTKYKKIINMYINRYEKLHKLYTNNLTIESNGLMSPTSHISIPNNTHFKFEDNVNDIETGIINSNSNLTPHEPLTRPTTQLSQQQQQQQSYDNMTYVEVQLIATLNELKHFIIKYIVYLDIDQSFLYQLDEHIWTSHIDKIPINCLTQSFNLK